MVHTYPCNKLFLFFPGIKNTNNCNNGYLGENQAITYLPNIKYNMTKPTLVLKQTKNHHDYIMLLLIVILVLLLTMGFFYFINKKK